jgi:hypothetical protein
MFGNAELLGIARRPRRDGGADSSAEGFRAPHDLSAGESGLSGRLGGRAVFALLSNILSTLHHIHLSMVQHTSALMFSSMLAVYERGQVAE